MSSIDCEICVVGGGVAGAATALALQRSGRSVRLIEARQPSAWEASHWDPRVYALSPASVAVLDKLGVWADVARPQPFVGMQVWDRGGAIEFSAQAMGLPLLGQIVEDAALLAALWPALGDAVISPATVTAMVQADDGVGLTLEDGRQISARLVVAADGPGSALREMAGIGVQRLDYGARAIVCHLQCSAGHADTAWQRFSSDGPIGLLPLADGRLSVVWSLSAALASEVLALNDEQFCARLGQALDGRLGEFDQASSRLSFPLQRQHAEQYVLGRLALLGDAAHVVHPLAGQGLNLGLADAACLADLLRQHSGDPASPSVLRRYQRIRAADNARMIAVTDSLDRLFSNNNKLLSGLRGAGLSAVNTLPALKHLLARAALGTTDLAA